jgi:hypothetical protein
MAWSAGRGQEQTLSRALQPVGAQHLDDAAGSGSQAVRTALTVLAKGPCMPQLGSHAVPQSLSYRSSLEMPTAIPDVLHRLLVLVSATGVIALPPRHVLHASFS